jgi:SurA-like protein
MAQRAFSALMTVAVALTAGCDGDAGRSSSGKRVESQSAGPPAARDAIARVGSAVITRQDLDGWLPVARSGEDLQHARPRGRRRRSPSAKREVMRFLIQAEWVRQEAARRGIGVPGAAVRERLRRQTATAYPSRRAYLRFLRQSRMSEAQVLARIELDLLQEAIRGDVVRSAGPGGRSAALTRSTAEFRRRYRRRTVCAPGYSVEECGAVSSL